MVADSINMIMAYFERKGCAYFERKISYCSVSSACNRKRHYPECVGRVHRTFCFTGAITGRSCSKADWLLKVPIT